MPSQCTRAIVSSGRKVDARFFVELLEEPAEVSADLLQPATTLSSRAVSKEKPRLLLYMEGELVQKSGRVRNSNSFFDHGWHE